MEIYNDPPPKYKVKPFQFFAGLAIVFFGLYLLVKIGPDSTENLFLSIGVMIVGGIIGNLARYVEK